MVQSVKIRITTGRQEHSNHIRKEVAALSQQSQSVLNPLLFNYDKNGIAIPEVPPPVRWGGGKKGFFIVGIGEDGVDCVVDTAIKVSRLLSKSRGDGVYRVDIAESRLDIAPLGEDDSAPLFRVGSPVIAINLKHQKRFKQADREARLELARQKIYKSLERQCRHFGIEFPEPSIAVTDVGEILYIKNHTFSDGSSRWSLGVRYIDFVCARHKLKGFWSVGHGLNTGNGGVRHLHKGIGQSLISPAQMDSLLEAE